MSGTGTQKTRYLLENIGLFSIATFMPKALTFLMIPLYTKYLSTSDYGRIDLLTNTVSLLMPIFTLQIQDAVMRYSIKGKYSPNDVLGVGVRVFLGGGIVLLILCTVLKQAGIVSIDSIFILFLFVYYITGTLNNIFSYFCRGINKVGVITASSILSAIITVICNLLFLLVFKWGVYGYLIANSLGATIRVTYIYFRANIRMYLYWKLESTYISKEMVCFSIPMIFSALSWWIDNASDKYILTFFSGVSIVGVYAVASKIPSILVAFGDVIAKAFSISAIKEFDSNDSDGFLGKSYSMFSFCMVMICLFVMTSNIYFARILFANDFFVAWKYVPPLLVAVLFNMLSLFCENILLAIGKTKVISCTAIVGAIVNTTFNLILIPRFDAYGAAIATFTGFFIAWFLRYTLLTRYVEIKHDLRNEVISYAIVMLQMVLAYRGNQFFVFELIILGTFIFVNRAYINIVFIYIKNKCKINQR